MKETLTFVERVDRIAKATNRPFVSIKIKTKEHGDVFISGFGNKTNALWKVGDTVEIGEVTTTEKDGRTYLNFTEPKILPGSSQDMARVEAMCKELNVRLRQVERWFQNQGHKVNSATGLVLDEPEDDGLEEPPF